MKTKDFDYYYDLYVERISQIIEDNGDFQTKAIQDVGKEMHYEMKGEGIGVADRFDLIKKIKHQDLREGVINKM